MLFNFVSILAYNFGGNSVREYLIAFGIFVLAIIVLKAFKKVVIEKIKKLVDHTATDFDDLLIKIIDSIGWPFYVFLSLYLAFQFLQLPALLEKIIFYTLIILIGYYLIEGAQELIDYGIGKIISKQREGSKRFDPSIIKLLGQILKVSLWVGVVIILLQILGFDVTALVAGLGIGGVAIAFALQSILGDIFASFAIYFDKPFQVGDYIVVGDDAGTVKHIGIKSTRIQSRQGEELIISNKELTTARVHNYKKMEKRRIVFSFGVTYDTPTEKLKRIPDIVGEVIGKIGIAEIDRVFFKEFGDFSLNFEVVYFLKSSDYKDFVETQPRINLALKEQFEKEGIEFAYPTQTVFVKK